MKILINQNENLNIKSKNVNSSMLNNLDVIIEKIQ